MGVRYENHCCGCAVPAYPCTGEHKKVLVHFCDSCGEDDRPIYEFYNKELCLVCLSNELVLVQE